MHLPDVQTHPILLPLAWLYEAGVRLRNWLFDRKWLRSTSFEAQVPVIAVGNVAAGGTGKTPHVEYLLQLFRKQDIGPVAVLSRGYGRRSHGFILADQSASPTRIGDEPFQIFSKFPEALVAVDADRVNGIQRLLRLPHPPRVILLDDAFQHRYVQAGLTICLTSFNRILYKDRVLPAGLLREPATGIQRADMVVVTKCPARGLSCDESTELGANMPIHADQPVFHSSLRYGQLVNLLSQKPTEIDSQSMVLMLTGIADPAVMEQYVAARWRLMSKMQFSDHHRFSVRDVAKIQKRLDSIVAGGEDNGFVTTSRQTATRNEAIIITTEKDASRLTRHPAVGDDLKKRIYILPTEVFFLDSKQEQQFNQTIINYVTENTANG